MDDLRVPLDPQGKGMIRLFDALHDPILALGRCLESFPGFLNALVVGAVDFEPFLSYDLKKKRIGFYTNIVHAHIRIDFPEMPQGISFHLEFDILAKYVERMMHRVHPD